jgi:MFS family permease
MAKRLIGGGHTIVGYARHAETVAALLKEGSITEGATSLPDLAKQLSTPRALWLMVPAASVDATLESLIPLLASGDVVIDGGNSHYHDDIRRAAMLAPHGIHYLDVGTSSGGVWGAERGYCLMIGGEVVGALVFGRMSDKFGRRKLFILTLGVYLVGSGLTTFTFGQGVDWIIYFYATRFVAGLGIGGEYAAINSAIDEMMPARYRGRVDVRINGTYWAGSILGTLASLLFLNLLPATLGWHLAFVLGPVLAIVIMLVRRNLPESPRWLITHGREQEAEEVVRRIEDVARRSGQVLEPVDNKAAIKIVPEKEYGYLTLLRVVFHQYPKRAVLGASLMITQSFLYNAIFFTCAIVLTKFYGVSATRVPIYGLAFAIGNLAGPLLLGGLFDTLGRKKMIAGTYILSGLLLTVSAGLFDAGALNATTQTIAWVVIFFFASAGASAGYLTVSEIFPIEIRAEAIAVFFAIAQVAGAIGPLLYGPSSETARAIRASLSDT